MNWHLYLLGRVCLVQVSEIMPSFNNGFFHTPIAYVIGISQGIVVRCGEHSMV
jgi:hypothetical protein